MEHPIKSELKNVHEVLSEAVQEVQSHEPMITATFKAPRETKRLAQQICRQNGTDLSTYLRKCCEALVRDYLPTK